MVRLQLALAVCLALSMSAPAGAQHGGGGHHSGGFGGSAGGMSGGHFHGGGFQGGGYRGSGGRGYSGSRGGYHTNHYNINGYGGYGLYGSGLFGYGLYGFPFGYSSYYSSANYFGPYGSSFYYGTAPLCYQPTIVYSNYGYNGYGLNGYISIPSTNLTPNAAAPLLQLQQEEELRWRQDLQFDPADLAAKPIKQSTAENRLRSQQDLIRGDGYFREQKFTQARASYLQAINHAEELPQPHFHMAVAAAAQSDFDRALRSLKRALDLDPKFPQEGVSVKKLYGDDNVIARDAMYSRLTEWVQQDVRDPDRLLLMGGLLYGDMPKEATVFLETSARLSGQTHYVAPYLADVSTVAEGAEKKPAPLKHVIAPGDPSPHVVVPEAPKPQKDATDVPPLPLPNDGTGQIVEPYQPIDLGFTLPRHGRIYRQPAAETTSTADGPTFPTAAN